MTGISAARLVMVAVWLGAVIQGCRADAGTGTGAAGSLPWDHSRMVIGRRDLWRESWHKPGQNDGENAGSAPYVLWSVRMVRRFPSAGPRWRPRRGSARHAAHPGTTGPGTRRARARMPR